MYNIRNLNIWKQSDILIASREKAIEMDTSKEKEAILSNKQQGIYEEILSLVPNADLQEIKKRRGNKLRYPIYINDTLMGTEIDALELSVRSYNCLRRAGYGTVGELVNAIESSEDLKKIRNCGAKSVDEIMQQIFFYQFGILDQAHKIRFINRVMELNRE